GHAVVIETARAPRLFNPCARGRNVPAGLARNDDRAHRAPREVDAGFRREFCEVQRVGWSRENDGDRVVEEVVEPCGAGHPSARYDQRAETRRGLERAPEPDERPEGEREEDAVVGGEPHERETDLPATLDPLPRLRSVEPAERLSGARAGGLVQPGVA